MRKFGSIKLVSLLSILSLCYTLTARAQNSSTSQVTATMPLVGVQGDTQPPSEPILVSPENNLVTSNPNLEFVWKKSFDPNGNTIFYTLYLDNVALYQGISDLGNAGGSTFTARVEGQEIKLVPLTAQKEGFHQWYVTAEDLSGNQSSSDVWYFTVKFALPVGVTLLTTRDNLSLAVLILLAIGILYMIILLRKKRGNLSIRVNGQYPPRTVTVYHSRPGNQSSCLFKANHCGEVYIPKLGRYSTLTIHLDEQTLVLSISRDRWRYLVAL